MQCVFTDEGSPPRMRGKVICQLYRFGAIGITPAHAGKSAAPPFRLFNHGDHPRACGEKQGRDLNLHCRVRITPAHAGKRRIPRGPSGRNRDHPRACGEKAMWVNLSYPFSGSPPRMRGKVVDELLHYRDGGITPAHAGKSYRDVRSDWADEDHPRACGEKSWFSAF